MHAIESSLIPNRFKMENNNYNLKKKRECSNGKLLIGTGKPVQLSLRLM